MIQIEARQLAFFHDAIERMRTKGIIEFEPGLTDEEVQWAETTYNLRFPPDLRAFLQIALPIAHLRGKDRSEDFPNWRDQTEQAQEYIRWRLEWPLFGIRFDIEHAGMWSRHWAERPDDLDAGFAIAQRKVAKAPLLIPVFIHRFMPAEPNEAGNPVFSVYQTDIIHYGYDLPSYLCKEFREAKIPLPEWAAKKPRSIDFWSDIVDVNGSWVRLGLIPRD